MALVDYEKAFVSIEICAILNSLSNSRTDQRCTGLVQSVSKRVIFMRQGMEVKWMIKSDSTLYIRVTRIIYYFVLFILTVANARAHTKGAIEM